MPNAYDDLQPTSPELQALAGQTGANAYDDIAPPPKPPPATEDQSPGTVGHQLVRGAGLSVRGLLQGAAALPMMIPDAATSLYDFAKNPHVPSWRELIQTPSNAPSQQFDRALDPYLPTPQTKSEKVASALLSMEGGAMTPQVPVPASSVPSNFQTAAQVKRALDAQTLKNSQSAGYVVPPSTTNPSIPNVALETVAGKINMQNAASAINQKTRNAAAASDIGLHPDLLTPEAVGAVKTESGKAFEGARTIPQVSTDSQYVDDLAKVLKDSHGSNASFPGSANPDVEKLVDTYLQPNFSGDSAVSAIKLLRGKASDAYRTGNSELGMAYKGLSTAIESQLERGAQQAGGPYADLVASLRNARRTYAKASTIEDAMDPSGNISGQKLAAAWNRDEPLSDNLLLAARHAAAFPKANGPVNASNVQHLNMLGPVAGAMAGHELTHSPWGYLGGAAVPGARMGSKAYLLSTMGQRGAIPPAETDRAFPAWAFGAATGATNP